MVDIRNLISHAREYRALHPQVSDDELQAELHRFIDEFNWGCHIESAVSQFAIFLWPIAFFWNRFASLKHDRMIKAALEISRKEL
jgi:hypothetical protein